MVFPHSRVLLAFYICEYYLHFTFASITCILGFIATYQSHYTHPLIHIRDTCREATSSKSAAVKRVGILPVRKPVRRRRRPIARPIAKPIAKPVPSRSSLPPHWGVRRITKPPKATRKERKGAQKAKRAARNAKKKGRKAKRRQRRIALRVKKMTKARQRRRLTSKCTQKHFASACTRTCGQNGPGGTRARKQPCENAGTLACGHTCSSAGRLQKAGRQVGLHACIRNHLRGRRCGHSRQKVTQRGWLNARVRPRLQTRF